MNRTPYHDNKRVMNLDLTADTFLHAAASGDQDAAMKAAESLAHQIKQLVAQGVLPSGEQKID